MEHLQTTNKINTAVSASLVAYKTDPSVLSKVFNSIVNSTVPIKCILIDNSPTTELRELTEKYGIQYHFTGQNLGFGRGHNIGISTLAHESKYHLIINPDVFFEPSEVSKMIHFLNQHSDIGLLGPQVLYPDGHLQRTCRLLPTPLDLIGRRFIPVASWVDRLNYLHEMKFSNLGDTIGVPCLVGCFLVCRSEILIKIGGFDPQFFLYLEDYDLCRRIGVNHRVVFYPHATIYHEYARGSYKNTRLLRYHMVSAIQYFFKHGWIFDRRRRSENLLAMKRYSRIDLNS